MITQYVVNLPEGKTTPDFQSKPMPVEVKEGQLAVFKAIVTGDPKPEVSWRRTKGNILNKNKFLSKYDESTGEHILEIRKVTTEEADTYKCLAVNEFGKAVCTTTLNLTEGKSCSNNAVPDVIADFRKLLRRSKAGKKTPNGESDDKFWEAMLNADRSDYERICAEFGITDIQSIVKQLAEKKKERKQKNFTVRNLSSTNNIISLVINIPLNNYDGFSSDCIYIGLNIQYNILPLFWTSCPNAIFLPDGEIPYDEDLSEKNGFKSRRRTKDYGINGPMQKDAWQNKVDEEVNRLFSELKFAKLDFVIKIQEIKAEENDDALFECVLTHPLPKISWMGKGSELEDGEKYSITVSDHQLIHSLLIKDCTLLDKGIYSVVAGNASCSAWLVVEDRDPASTGKKTVRSGTLNGGGRIDLEKLAKEQQLKNQEEMEKILAAVKEKYKEELLKDGKILAAGSDGEISEDTGPGKNSGEIKSKSKGKKGKVKFKISGENGVHFICGLSDVSAIIHETAELTCRLSSEDCDGVWYRDGRKISPDDNFTISKDGAIHKLVIISCTEEHSGKYRFEADGRKTEAMINIKDPPRFDHEDLRVFIEPLTVKTGHNAIFKLHFVGHEPIKIQWYKEGDELQDDNNTRIEKSASHSRLLLSRCQRKDTGEIKIKLKNEHGFIEAISQLTVLDKPTPPQGPAEVTESSAMCIEFRWRPPKDDGVGRNTWKKLGEIPGVPSYRDNDVDHGRKYCYHIRAVTAEGLSDIMETDDMQAGTLAFPGPPSPPKVISAYDDCINISWDSPSNKGGSRILGYILEKRKKGSNLWTVVNALDELIKEKKYAVKDVVAGMEYEFRVTAINLSGAGENSSPSEFVFARDPKMRPKFTNHKMKSFMVVRAGNSVRITVNFEASPQPKIIWLKDNVPVTKRVTVSNSDGTSQLLIPSSERSDTGIYSILVKNLAGQETFSTEVRVTDDPKPPGSVELEENVPGTITMIWEPSPDEKRDDRLHYIVSKLDSTKRTWTTVAERLFNNKFTVCNIMLGREYNFRIYAKNDMGVSAPSESPTWGMERKKGVEDRDLRCAPTFLVPLKLHTAPKGYECYMSCAVKGDPKPRITWYRNHISLNTNTNYYISDTCGVCSMLILRVGPKDMGEYTISAENALGRAECSTVLSVRGEGGTHLQLKSEHSLWFKGTELIKPFPSLFSTQSEEMHHEAISI
uniref:Immunoglobulin like and fibronectin type III domain containing 1, tandem duplicate 3 n=1 Tax=Labrus bergylta TaxID=56723 RepID=A0A3Q3EVE8_9LABR